MKTVRMRAAYKPIGLGQFLYVYFLDVVILWSWKLVCVIGLDTLYECYTFDPWQLNKAK